MKKAKDFEDKSITEKRIRTVFFPEKEEGERCPLIFLGEGGRGLNTSFFEEILQLPTYLPH